MNRGIASAWALSYDVRIEQRGQTYMMTQAAIAVYLIALNSAAFWLFVHDKRAAIAGHRRIPEDRLLAVAFLGGSIGCKLGQMIIRHKIRKEPFRQQLNGILAVQLVAMAAAFALSMLQTPPAQAFVH
jgi:uncharacterized membrane protein YsdA (DUF1294 family)